MLLPAIIVLQNYADFASEEGESYYWNITVGLFLAIQILFYIFYNK